MLEPQPQRDPVSDFGRQVLALYADALPHLRFPDLDLAVLEADAAELRAAQRELERLERELEAARALLHAQAEAFDRRAERALGYARVFASGDASLSERVAEVERAASSARVKLAPPGSSAQPRKRGRPKRNEGDASLFGLSEAPPLAAAEAARASP